MGTEYIPQSVQSGFFSTDILNNEFAKIATEFANMLNRTGFGTNSMSASLDLGTNQMLNVSEGVQGTDGVNLNQVINLATSIATSILETGGAGQGQTTGDPITFNYGVTTGSTGTMTRTVFDLNALFGVTEMLGLTVVANGVIQFPTLAYSVSLTTTVTFTESMEADTELLFIYGDLSPVPIFSNVNATLGETAAVATAAQVLFTAPTYTIGLNQLLVSIDGVLQSKQQGDYTETTSTSITLDEAMVGGENVVIRNITGL